MLGCALGAAVGYSRCLSPKPSPVLSLALPGSGSQALPGHSCISRGELCGETSPWGGYGVGDAAWGGPGPTDRAWSWLGGECLRDA